MTISNVVLWLLSLIWLESILLQETVVGNLESMALWGGRRGGGGVLLGMCYKRSDRFPHFCDIAEYVCWLLVVGVFTVGGLLLWHCNVCWLLVVGCFLSTDRCHWNRGVNRNKRLPRLDMRDRHACESTQPLSREFWGYNHASGNNPWIGIEIHENKRPSGLLAFSISNLTMQHWWLLIIKHC